MSNISTYFSTLSTDELWMCWQQLGKIFPASNEGENLSKVQIIRGNDAPFAKIGQCYIKHLYLDCSSRNPSSIDLNDDAAADMDIIQECGHSLTHFHAIDAENGPSAQVIEAVRAHCTSIMSVCLKFSSPRAHGAIELWTWLRSTFLKDTICHGSSDQERVAQWGGLLNDSAGYRLPRFRDWSPWWMFRTRIGSKEYRWEMIPRPFLA